MLLNQQIILCASCLNIQHVILLHEVHLWLLMKAKVRLITSLAEIEEGTCNFSKKIGEGSFGPVYYGKMKDGKEVAVKISSDQSSHGTQ